MTFLDIFALTILFIMVVIIVGFFYFLASLPGRIAHNRNHPNAKAIEVGGFATLVFGVVLWPVVLMWAYQNFEESGQSTDPVKEANV